MHPVKITSGYIRTFTLKGLDRETVRAPNNRVLLRFQNDNQLNCLRSILGNAVTIGQRVRRPRLFERVMFRPLNRLHVIFGRNSIQPVRLGRGDRSSRIDFIISDYDSQIVLYYDDYLLSINLDELVNRRNENIIDNEFIQYMLESNFD